MTRTDEKRRWVAVNGYFVGYVLIGISVAFAVGIIWVASQRQLSDLELALSQVVALGAGLSGSYIFGKRSARTAAMEVVKPAARSAFRRVLGIRRSQDRLAEKIRGLRKDKEANLNHLNLLEILVDEHRFITSDAMEDWRDIVPEEVAEVEKRWKRNQNSMEVETLDGS